MIRRRPLSTLFPYTTLFRSIREIGKLLLVLGLVLAAAGAILLVGGKLPFRLGRLPGDIEIDRKSTRLNSSHANISYAVFCLKKKRRTPLRGRRRRAQSFYCL